MAIQNRRGIIVDLDPQKLLPGEFGISLDNKEARICFEPGVVKTMATKEDFQMQLGTLEANIERAKTAALSAESLIVNRAGINDMFPTLTEAYSGVKTQELIDNITFDNATETADGLMTKEDKTKVNRIGDVFNLNNTDLVTTVNELNVAVTTNTSDIGERMLLNTKSKSSLVDAINENTTKIDTKANKTDLDIINTNIVLKADKTEIQANNLTFKESYDTFESLKTAYPTGDIYNHCVLNDGLIYTWNSILSTPSWVSTGIQGVGTGIPDNTVTPSKTSFFINTKNIFNKEHIIADKWIVSESGDIFDFDGGYDVSELISVTPSETYSSNEILTNNVFTIAYYDINGTWISMNEFGSNTFTAPSTAYFMRLGIKRTILDTLCIVLGNKIPIYVPYKVIDTQYLPNYIYKKRIKDIIAKIVLSDSIVNIKFIGDSITHGVGGTGFNQDGIEIVSGWNVNTSGVCFANMFKSYMEGKFNCNVTNFGCTGTTSQFIVTNFDNLVTENDNIVICMIGTNDRNQGTTAQLTYYNNLKIIYTKAKEKGCDIIFMSGIPASVVNETDVNNPKDYHMEDVDNIILKLSSDLHIEYISLYQEFTKYCETKNITIDSLLNSDGLHPNDNGYAVMYKLIMQQLGLGTKREQATW